MATQGTPYGGLNDVAALAYVSGALTLVCYTNTADSLVTATVAADLTQPSTANGYAPITLDGTWSTSNGVLTYVHSTPTNPTWTATGAWSATVTGVAIIRGATVRHFKDLGSAFVASTGRKLAVDLASVLS
jgi:hypothetical protein